MSRAGRKLYDYLYRGAFEWSEVRRQIKAVEAESRTKTLDAVQAVVEAHHKAAVAEATTQDHEGNRIGSAFWTARYSAHALDLRAIRELRPKEQK